MHIFSKKVHILSVISRRMLMMYNILKVLSGAIVLVMSVSCTTFTPTQAKKIQVVSIGDLPRVLNNVRHDEVLILTEENMKNFTGAVVIEQRDSSIETGNFVGDNWVNTVNSNLH